VGEFIGGLMLGVFLGIVLGPAIRLWVTWHEWTAASREARLTEDVMKRMDARLWRLHKDKRAAGTSRAGHRPQAP
jgi:accessory colonization factor AcfC